MSLFKSSMRYGIESALLLALVTAFIGLAHSRPTASWERRAEVSGKHLEATLRGEEPGMSTGQKPDSHPKDPWTDEQLINPEELLKQMDSAEKPLVLHIGMPFLFKSGHIAGSRYVGQGSTPAGIETLKKATQGLQQDRAIVLYCGCCPWKDCPNIRPAFKALKDMQFTRVKVLNLPNSFGQDWAMKGLPVEKGENSHRSGT